MPQTLLPLAGMYDADEIAAMAAVLDEVCAEAASLGLLERIAQSEIRTAIGEMIIEVQSRQRLAPEQLKLAVMSRIEAQIGRGVR